MTLKKNFFVTFLKVTRTPSNSRKKKLKESNIYPAIHMYQVSK